MFVGVPAPSLHALRITDAEAVRRRGGVGTGCGFGNLHQEFDDADVFSFRSADGTRSRARSRQRDVDLDRWRSTATEGGPVVFDVPEDTTAGTVVVDLSRARSTVEVGAVGFGPSRCPVRWAIPPAPVELAVSFT